MTISPQLIEEIKYRNNISDVISGYVSLKRAGSNMNGLCPFHSEKTPSFTVFNDSSSFYCFGCGAGGDVITFVMKMENLDYMQAVEQLAKRAGITIPKTPQEEKSDIKRSRIYDMNRDAARYFHTQLMKGGDGLDYLMKKRGLPASVIKRFGLGFAPDDFGALTSHMRSLGYTEEELTAGFLCGISKKTGRAFDYFRNRVMFPIIDVSGNVIAFGGRVMDDSTPKYLNSSDTVAFKKSKNLFALNYAKSQCSENMILCEGYMDVIALHAAGFGNAVATLGTALTPEQARLMKRYTQKVYISYDSDDAGQRAAERAFALLGEAGLEVKIIKMEGAKDPDEYIKKFGVGRFKQLIDNSLTQFDYKMNGILAKYDVSLNTDKIKAASELAEYISGVYSSVEREVYIVRASEKLGIQPPNLKADVDRLIRQKARTRKKEDTAKMIRSAERIGDRVNPDALKNVKAAYAEEAIIGILLLFPEYIDMVIQGKIILSSDMFVTDFNKRVFETVIKCAQDASESDGNFDIGMLGSEFSTDEMGRIVKMQLSRKSLAKNDEKVLLECIKTLSRAGEKELDGISGISSMLEAKRKTN